MNFKKQNEQFKLKFILVLFSCYYFVILYTRKSQKDLQINIKQSETEDKYFGSGSSVSSSSDELNNSSEVINVSKNNRFKSVNEFNMKSSLEKVIEESPRVQVSENSEEAFSKPFPELKIHEKPSEQEKSSVYLDK